MILFEALQDKYDKHNLVFSNIYNKYLETMF
jgi:hypothetical protein